jgi:hypothetical protein
MFGHDMGINLDVEMMPNLRSANSFQDRSDLFLGSADHPKSTHLPWTGTEK